MAGHRLVDHPVVIADDIQQIGGVGKGACLHKVQMNRVVFQHTGLGIGVNDHLVVAEDGILAGTAGDDILASTAKPGHVVHQDTAGKDELIGSHGDFIGPHLMAVAGGAHQLAGGFLTVVLHHGYTAVNILGDEAAHLLLGHGAVHPVGKQYGDILIRHAGFVQLPHQDGDINVAAGQAGDVIGKDAHGITGVDLLGQQPGPNGMGQRVLHDLLLRANAGGVLLGQQDAEVSPFGDLDIQQLAAVLYLIFHGVSSLS